MHPNDHVNMAQSTNDVIPTAMRLAVLATLPSTLAALDVLATAFLAKGTEFDDVIKSGRTHLQDATPIRLGQEFTAYGHTVQRHRQKLAQAADWLREMNIGGTAVGTGINAEREYPGADGEVPAAGERPRPAGRARTAFSSCSRWATSPR